MTALINDTLQKQIQRGEVFFYSSNDQYFEVSEYLYFRVTTDSVANCSCLFEFLCDTIVEVRIYENPSSTTLLTNFSPVNMNRESTRLLGASTSKLSSFSGGTFIASAVTVNGALPANSPFSKEAGIILKPNEEYIYQCQNIGTGPAYFSYSIFLRENA